MSRILGALLAASILLLGSTAFAHEPGDLVLGKWGDGNFYPARVAKVDGDKVYLAFYDGDVGVVAASDVKVFDWKVGSKIQCNWKRKGTYYSGKIAEQTGEWLHINYDDGDKEETGIGRCRVK